MNKMFAALLLSLAFAGTAFSLSIDAPDSVAINSSFGFTVNLDSGYTFAKILVNDVLVVEVNSNGSITTGPFNGAFSLNQASNRIFVSVFRAGSDTVSISAETNDNSESKSVSVYTPISASEIESQINSKVGSKLDEYDQLFINQEADNKGFWDKLNSVSAKADSLEQKIGSVEGSIGDLSGDVSDSSQSLSSLIVSLENRVKELEKAEADRQAVLLAEEEAKKNSPLTGLFNFAGSNVLGIGFIIIVVIVGALAFVFRDKIKIPKLDSIYSGPMERDEHNLPISRDQEEMANAISDEGKWSFK